MGQPTWKLPPEPRRSAAVYFPRIRYYIYIYIEERPRQFLPRPQSRQEAIGQLIVPKRRESSEIQAGSVFFTNLSASPVEKRV